MCTLPVKHMHTYTSAYACLHFSIYMLFSSAHIQLYSGACLHFSHSSRLLEFFVCFLQNRSSHRDRVLAQFRMTSTIQACHTSLSACICGMFNGNFVHFRYEYSVWSLTGCCFFNSMVHCCYYSIIKLLECFIELLCILDLN